MAELKTKPTTESVEAFLASIPDESRRADCTKLVELMGKITGEKPVMWTKIIGFGSYRYKYASGREGDWMRLGVASRADSIVLYGVIYYGDNTKLLEKLGKHKHGKGCLYIKRLSDIDLDVLEEMIRTAYAKPHMAEAA